MKKIIPLLIFTAVILWQACDKEYYDPEDIKYSISLGDTIQSGVPITLKSNIDKPLDINVYFDVPDEEHFIGNLKPYSDSLVWNPQSGLLVKGRTYKIWGRIVYKEKRKKKSMQLFYQEFFVKE